MILFCFGTRPEWLKIKPILAHLHRNQYRLFFTGQHNDLLKDIKVDYRVNIKKTSNDQQRLNSIIESCLKQFPNNKCSKILVQGDTASAFACAIAAFHNRMKIYYLEAGLRSYNFSHPFPEEGYRQMIARLADINFAPTKLSYVNLKNEKVKGKTYITGNTVLDNLLLYKNKINYTNTILVTLHRRENFDLLKQWFEELNSLAKKYPELKFILPLHPNPNVQKYRHLLKHVNIIKPQSHENLLNILTNCKFVITDSGGLQEEGSFLDKKVIVCRITTERPEGINTGHLHICSTPSKLKNIFKKINSNFKINKKCPYGDGKSAIKIAKILLYK